MGRHGRISWVEEVPSSWLAYPPEGWFVFTGASLAIFASGMGEPWGKNSPEVGFVKVEEVYFQEDIPDYDVWS